MSHLPIDPQANSSRRAWVPCPNCNRGHDCPECRECPTHWQYLLENEGSRVSLQCPDCAHLWTVDAQEASRRERNVVATIPLDSHARDLVVSPDGDRIFATTAKSVNVIDRAHSVIASIPVDVDLKRTMLSPDGSRLYVFSCNGSISIINTADYTVQTVSRDASTAEVVSPNGAYVYLAHNQGRNSWVSAIDGDGTMVTAVPVDSYATALALNPAAGRLYVASSKPWSSHQRHRGSISLIDTATFSLVDVIPTEFVPDTIVTSPDGSRVYASHYNNNAISVIEPASNSHTLIGLDDAPLEIAVSPDGDRLYVTNLHSLALIDTATNVAESVPLGDLPRHFRISGDGKHAYVTDFAHHSVWVLDPINKAIITMVDLGRDPEALALSADEKSLYVADYSAPTLTAISLSTSHRSPNRAG